MSVNPLDAVIMLANFGLGEWAFHRVFNTLGVDREALNNPFLQRGGTTYYPVPPPQMMRALACSTATEMAAVSITGLSLDHFIQAVSQPGLEMTHAQPWFPIALGLGCSHGLERLHELARSRLLRSGVLSQPDNRSEWSPTGRVIDETTRCLLRTGALWVTLAACLPGDGQFAQGGTLALEALVASVTSIIAEKMFPREFPDAALPRRMIEHRFREREVYHGYAPFVPRFRRADVKQWDEVVTSLPLFQEEVTYSRRHRDHHGLLWIRKSESDPLCGVAFFVTNSQTYRDLIQGTYPDPLTHYFTEQELSEIIGPRLERITNPREKLSKLADLIEIKKAIWTFLTGTFPETKSGWDPHEIEIVRNPSSHLIDYRLSDRLEALRSQQGIGEIRTTWSDEGRTSVGILSFRRSGRRPRILGTGIDIADHRQFLQRADGKPYLKDGGPQEPIEFFSAATYRERYSQHRPTARELARHHATSEALYKAVYPKMPESGQHGPHLYRQFDVDAPEPTQPWSTLRLRDEYEAAATSWGTREAQTGHYRIGPLEIAITLLLGG